MAVSKAEQPPQVPPPPQINRKIKFNPVQAIGMPFIILIPVLGLFGLFDTHQTTTSTEQNGMALTVKYPTKFRHKVGEPMQIIAENKSGAEMPKMLVRLSQSYLNSFENAQFIPEAKEVENGFVVFEFTDVGPGEQRLIEFEMEASHPGTNPAEITAGPEDGPGARLHIDTFILP